MSVKIHVKGNNYADVWTYRQDLSNHTKENLPLDNNGNPINAPGVSFKTIGDPVVISEHPYVEQWEIDFPVASMQMSAHRILPDPSSGTVSWWRV